MEQVARTAEGKKVGRRSNARARLGIPAHLILLDGQFRCTVLDLSRQGARVSVDREMRLGQQGILQRDGLDEFFTVVWAADGRSGLVFDEVVPVQTVKALKDLADHYQERTQERLRQFGREWVEGNHHLAPDE